MNDLENELLDAEQEEQGVIENVGIGPDPLWFSVLKYLVVGGIITGCLYLMFV